ncbi:PREDICTED: F-box protein SKIP1 [Tarenaya hassleriana]|uniref:F-box protein SKIP1 n=1 Tax=Tarenaya hassleriana TaxID=28532 RepID=UPI00053C2587|nr:PREDICTED: F-box protein SKIP1 [Tarenaya hassleriana]
MEGDGREWSGLAREMMVNILSRLTLEERWKGPMFVCKSWLLASRDPFLFSVFDLEPFFGSHSSSSSRFWSPDFERRIDSMIRSVVDWSNGRLAEIRLRHCTDASISYVADRCPDLQILATRSCPNITDASMSKISFRCTKLKELDISYCHEISHHTLVVIGTNCPNLTILKRNLMSLSETGSAPAEYLGTCPQDGDVEAEAIGEHMPNLHHLEIESSRLTLRGLTAICEGCRKLENVDLSGCVHLSSRDIESAASILKNLREMKKPDVYIPRQGIVAAAQTERYGHWRLYDERFDVQSLRF